MNRKECLFLTAVDVQDILGISRAKAYKLIKEWNMELAKNGYIVISGKIPKAFFNEKLYGSII